MSSKKQKGGSKSNIQVAAAIKEPEAFVKPTNRNAPKQKPSEPKESVVQLPQWMYDDPPSTNETDKGMCMSMWQPWASLVISGVKRLEGRVWRSDFRGRLWIHAASKALDEDEKLEIEESFKEVEGASLPTSYPQSALLGCVDVIDMISHEELMERKEQYQKLLDDGIPPAPHVEYYIKEENQSDYCFVCIRPKALAIPLAMSGDHKIFPLEKKIHEAAKAQLGILQTSNTEKTNK